eukprot:CAMPEP_0202735958 /NCGR_PEP_ID=MMETSP1388-20130828/714_1 /ASSEMBLY_ACC=CAM_ASM_000864 /TAXON_ID=37098 /ORGANISM="Isochrysis sp, Strain CCMP1244" /LENGTH=177 /DNA_ID=CAMNT_0049402431 /DNA_START=72 /DNA_END=607 /DNA_ORIENTATION=-
MDDGRRLSVDSTRTHPSVAQHNITSVCARPHDKAGSHIETSAAAAAELLPAALTPHSRAAPERRRSAAAAAPRSPPPDPPLLSAKELEHDWVVLLEQRHHGLERGAPGLEALQLVHHHHRLAVLGRQRLLYPPADLADEGPFARFLRAKRDHRAPGAGASTLRVAAHRRSARRGTLR